jgi:hypothetical protein
VTHSIENKIKSAFGIVNWLMIVVAAVGIVALTAVCYSAKQAVRVGARLNEIGLEIQSNNLMARRLEKDFLLNIKTLGVEKSKQQYVSKMPGTLARMEDLAREGVQIATNAADRERLESVPAQVRSYGAGFAGVVAAIERRGHVDTGAEGAFREAAHHIEKQVKNQDKLVIALLTLRRSEKDYLLRGDDKYIALTLENADKFQAAARASGMSPTDKGAAFEASDAYRSAFLVLTGADREVVAKTAIYEEATRRLEAVSDALARAGFAASQVSLARAARTAWLSIFTVVLISAGTIWVGVRYGTRISAHIIRPVKHLTGVAERVSMGDLSLPVDHTCDDEIGDLEDSLARLVTAVKFYQIESQEAAESAASMETNGMETKQ